MLPPTNHPYLTIAIPDDAPFRLQQASRETGWGAFATRRISRGEVILKEKPACIIRKSYENITVEDLNAAYEELSDDYKHIFTLDRDDGTVPAAAKGPGCAFEKNFFQIGCDNDPPMFGMYILQSRFNHSCRPNSAVPLAVHKNIPITRVATRDIEAGEEITFAYHPMMDCYTREERWDALGFVCKCEACTLASADEQNISDMRRRLCRGLYYLIRGIDLAGGVTSMPLPPGPPPTFDPELRRAVETCRVPIPLKFIATVMIGFLTEEEGTLDSWAVEKSTGSLQELLAALKNKDNIETAKLAMQQSTWVEALYVAMRLYGKDDTDDGVVFESV